MIEVADVFRRYGTEYLQRFGERMPSRHRRAFRDILQCRTPAMGGHVFACNRCGRQQYSYHSCRNRSCPKCHQGDIEIWLQRRQQELLPVPYYHVIFTLPHELSPPVRLHQKQIYGLLLKSAAESLVMLAADRRYVGGQVGVMAVLHTWASNLTYHPHVHCLVTGGGLSPDRQSWRPARNNYLVPVLALSRLFRGRLLNRIHRQCKDMEVPQSVWRKEWVVHCKPAVQGRRSVLNYLARYIHRVAITNSRILSIDNGQVRFRYRGTGITQTKVMAVSTEEFMRRFLQHVLPARVHKVRYYGLWSSSNRKHLRRMHQILIPPESDLPVSLEDERLAQEPSPVARPCPFCRQGTLVMIGRLPRHRRAPP
ncbi:IS91 family transposase [Planctomycetota bacterium]